MSKFTISDKVLMIDSEYQEPFTVISPINITLCHETGVAILVVVIAPINIESFKEFIKLEHGIELDIDDDINVSIPENDLKLV